jgi:type IV fimbrial biogenesis protein FimT
MTVSGQASRARRRSGSGAGGFTLVELLVTLFIAALLLTFGVSSFNGVVLGARVSAIANDMIASIQLARSEAIKRNLPITLCRSADGTTCATSSNWAAGWIVADGATIVQYHQAVPEGFKVTQSGTAGPLTFQPIGVGATAATFTVCRASPVGKQERVVTVSATGVAYVTTTEAGSCP